MKILMLGWELPPHNSGGLGIACYQLCKTLAQKQVDIEFVLPYSAEHNVSFMQVTAAHPQDIASVKRSGIAYDSFQYTYTDGSSEYLSIFEQQALFETSIDRVTAGKTYDIIHAHDWLTFRAGLRAKERTGCPLILHVHSVESDRAGNSQGNPLVHEIEATAMHLADKIFAVSELTKRAIMRDYHIPAGKIEVVHNSIDQSELAPLDAENSYRYLTAMKKQGYRVVVNVGRLTIQKGLPNLLYAAKEVIARRPKTLFMLVGSGEQYHELINLAARLGIGGNVIFTDFQRGKRWRDAYAVADLFVMPSISEPFGLTPLEAIGYGTPSLVSKQSGVSEIFRNCLKVDYWDIHEMANKINAVMQSDQLRNEIARNAQYEFEHLSWDSIGDKVVGLYQQHRPAVSKLTKVAV